MSRFTTDRMTIELISEGLRLGDLNSREPLLWKDL